MHLVQGPLRRAVEPRFDREAQPLSRPCLSFRRTLRTFRDGQLVLILHVSKAAADHIFIVSVHFCCAQTS